MTFTEAFREFWFSLAIGRRVVLLAAATFIVGVVAVTLVDDLRARHETRVYEREAADAKRKAADAIEHAAKIASEIKVREEELLKIEAKRDEKQREIDQAKGNVSRDRADYERAVRERRPDVPTVEQLCTELATLGYPCG